ncbi:MAG: AIR synthase-related protein, partial [Acidimicrobiales bacterium]
RVEAGDVLVGLLSPGLRSNGYSLARRVLLEVAGRSLDGPAFAGSPDSLADELLRPSEIYSPAIQHLCRAVEVRALAHITGGGLPGNVARVLPRHCDALVRRGSWPVPRIFEEIQRAGEVSDAEMSRVFNLGVGMVAVVPRRDLFHALDALRSRGREAEEIGEVVPGEGRVVLD